MRHKLRNIQTILFSTYSLIIVLVFAILVAYFYWWASGLLKRNATGSLENLGQSIQDQTDSELRKMNDVSLNVMYSNLVKNRFKKYISDVDGIPAEETDAPGNLPGASTIQSAKDLADILTAAIGPSRPVEQLYLYDFSGKAYGNGFDNGERRYRPADKPWYDAVVSNTEGKFINLPVPDEEMTKYISSGDTQYSVSLLRLFYDEYNVPIGIVEVKQYFNRIFKSALDYQKSSAYGERVLVYDRQGRIVYPLGAAAADYAPYVDYAKQRLAPGSAFTSSFRNPGTGDKELLSYHSSAFSGWSTVVIVSEKKLLHPLSRFARTTVLVAMAILLFAIVLSFAAAKRITYPIQKIHRAIRGMSFDALGSGHVPTRELNSGLNELDQLHGSFVQMSARLKQSMDELLLAQAQELQSKMLALQSQMNPHFLYNALTTIGVMAEENMNEGIVQMSGNMSDILRYIASDEPDVPMEMELEHTSQYLDINRIRHGANLRYEFDVDDGLLAVRVPKLIVQPLVENALKFATKGEPPWLIRIRGVCDADGWFIEVTDSGPGFGADALERLCERIAEVERAGVIPALTLNGMGLLNICIRLKLGYGARARFELSNRPEGGACVVIGGSYHKGG